MDNNLINDEQQRWQAFQQGDKEALSWFFNTYVTHLFNYGLKFTPTVTIIEDTIQDLFIRLWTTRERLSMPPSVKHYLLKAFRNLLYRKLSQQQRSMSHEQASFRLDVELSPEARRISIEQEQIRGKKLEQAIQQLPARQKEAIYLRFYEQASYEDIARIMGTSVRATYKNVFRGLSFLRETLLSILFYFTFLRF